MEDQRGYVIANRGRSRASLLREVRAGLPDVGAVKGAVTVLYLRELDGQEILARAERVVRQAQGERAGQELVWAVKRYKQRYPTLGGEEDYGDMGIKPL